MFSFGRKGGMIRWHRAVITVLLLGVVAALLLVALVHGPDRGGRATRQGARSVVDEVVRHRIEARKHWLASARARRQRVWSRGAFVGLDRHAIAALVRREFPGAVDAVKSMVQPGEVKRYTSDYTAIVDSGPGAKAAGGTALAVSSVPLRTGSAGHRQPVDLSLRDTPAGLEPANSLASFMLPANLAGDVELPSRVPLSIASGHASGVTPSRIGPSTALYPGVDTDTDLLASATPRGLELFRLLRSPRSPATEELRLRLPRGTSLTQGPGGGALVVRGGRPVLSIAAPGAVDAQGTGVPVTMQVAGEMLRITVSRRSDDWAYPILVDPAIDSYASSDFPGWGGFNYATPGASPASGNYSLSGDCMFGRSCFGAGLNIYAWQNQFYAGGSYAGFSYRTPGDRTTFIARATFGSVGYYNGEALGTPYMYAGLWDSRYGQNNWQALYQSYWFGTFDLSRLGDSPLVKEVDVQLNNWAGYDRRPLGDHHAYVGTATLYLDDTEVPHFGWIFRPPWVDQKPAPIPLTVTDEGLGIASLTLTAPGGGQSWQTSVGCAGGNRNPCPPTWSSPANGNPDPSHGDLGYDPSVLPQGVDTLPVSAMDAAGHVSGSGNDVEVRVDHTDPTVDLSGSLASLSQSQSGGH
jgi:hypothetical protein